MKKQAQVLTESMYYVLMALYAKDTFGTEIVEFIEKQTLGRVPMGPGTLYTILSKFESEELIQEIAVEGRKRTYAITHKGRHHFELELMRLGSLVRDGREIIKEKEDESI